MARETQKFKLIIVKAESKLYSDPEWVIDEDMTFIGKGIVMKIILALSKARSDVAGWNAENDRIIRDGV